MALILYPRATGNQGNAPFSGSHSLRGHIHQNKISMLRERIQQIDPELRKGQFYILRLFTTWRSPARFHYLGNVLLPSKIRKVVDVQIFVVLPVNHKMHLGQGLRLRAINRTDLTEGGAVKRD